MKIRNQNKWITLSISRKFAVLDFFIFFFFFFLFIFFFNGINYNEITWISNRLGFIFWKQIAVISKRVNNLVVFLVARRSTENLSNPSEPPLHFVENSAPVAVATHSEYTSDLCLTWYRKSWNWFDCKAISVLMAESLSCGKFLNAVHQNFRSLYAKIRTIPFQVSSRRIQNRFRSTDYREIKAIRGKSSQTNKKPAHCLQKVKFTTFPLLPLIASNYAPISRHHSTPVLREQWLFDVAIQNGGNLGVWLMSLFSSAERLQKS